MTNYLKRVNRFLKKYHLIKWIVFITLTICVFFSSYLLYLAKTANVDTLKASLEQTTVVYDRQDEEAGRLMSQKGTYVSLDQISKHLIDAVISTEDKRFYEHNGLDYLGIARAGVGFLFNGFKVVGGGSTLTQQLAKNAYLTQKQTFIRKAQEMFLALEIERVYTKDDILAMYLNHAYFGYGVWGVQDASLKYFGQAASELDVGQSAVLAAMLKGPTYYNPIDNKERALNRRNTILQLMLDNQKIDQETYDKQVQLPITLVDGYSQQTTYQYPYFFDSVIQEAQDRYGIDETELLTNGYKIYTTLDQAYQKAMDTVYATNQLFPTATDGTLSQSASVVQDVKTGGVLAIVGGRGDHVYRGFNRATQMVRQPGSTIKPLVVYTPALEQGYTPESMLLDEVKSYGVDQYTPQNWNNENIGHLPMYQALAESKNTSAVWLLNQIGLNKGLDKLHQFGIQTEKEDENLAIALGGMTKGTTLLAMTSAYTAFANKGVREDAYFITKIVDASGTVIVNKTHTDSYRVMNDKVASDMTRMMLGVYEAGGTGGVHLPNHLQIAGKTGTSEKYRDQWAIGYTPDFVLTTWLGYDNDLNGSSQATVHPIFNQLVNQIIAVSPQTAFQIHSLQSEKEPSEETTKNWLDTVQETAKQIGEGIQKGVTDLWNGMMDWFNGE